MLAALPMGGQKITGMATPTVATDAVTKAYADALGPTSFIVTGTGTADIITGVFTPTITSLTNGLTVEVRATAANATTTPTFQADATAAKTIVKGAGIALIIGNIPGAGFWMSLTYDSVLDKWVLNNPAIIQPASPVPGSFSNLVIFVANNTTLTATADFVTTTDGINFKTTPVNSTINMATTGINALDFGTIAAATWYAIWTVVKADGTTGAIASLQATANATFLSHLPSGYLFYARIGWVRTAAGSAQLMGTYQKGRKAQYVVGLAQTTLTVVMTVGPLGSTSIPTWSSVSVSNFVPTTASEIRISMRTFSTDTAMVAPNGSYGAFSSATNPPPVMSANVSGQYTAILADLMLEQTNIFFAATSANDLLVCMGWIDNI